MNRRESVKYYIVKLVVPMTLVVSMIAVLIVHLTAFAVDSSCSSERPLIQAPLTVFVVALTMYIYWKIKHFRDNFNIHLEIKRACISYTMIPVALILSILRDRYPVLELPLSQFIIVMSSVGFVIVGYFPLVDQKLLEKRLRNNNFEHSGKFDALLQDRAA